MKRIGIIGSGDMGSGIARLAVAAGYEVLIANSRGPAALQGLIDELGPQARSGDVREAAEFGEIPVDDLARVRRYRLASAFEVVDLQQETLA